MNAIRRLLILALVPVLISAAPAKQIIPLPDNDAGGEALIVPADSPVHFRGWNKYGYAQFDGRFVLTGTFMYGCGEGDCEGAGPYKESELTLAVVPDAELAARLPNWKIRHNDMMILISRWRPVEHSLATVAERRAPSGPGASCGRVRCGGRDGGGGRLAPRHERFQRAAAALCRSAGRAVA